ncbi:MAG: PilZ domain-containing protein [Candidatus Omnitrophica bacterium]|nr:PilZ domain-containing protein [Candidatus Omnitrophota bacterium]MDD5487440.1 PilZ domain-containing protein [Candidatus Omnitrophota bacterium]
MDLTCLSQGFLLIPGMIFSFILGFMVGYSSFEASGKARLRKMLESEHYDEEDITKFLDMRCEKRVRQDRDSTVRIHAPLFNGSGIIEEHINLDFEARVLDVSRNGMAILSQHFLKKGLNVHIISSSGSDFHIPAEVRNLRILSYGIRIGLRFAKPIR